MSASGGNWLPFDDPQVISVWERTLGREVRAREPLFDPDCGLTGKEDTSLIQIKDDLAKGPGASIQTKMRYQLEGKGRAGDETLKGHGEGYKTSTFTIFIDVVRHMVETSSQMVAQYVHEDSLQEGADGLADWFANRHAFVAHAHATGFTAVNDPVFNFHNTIQALNPAYIIRPNRKTKAEDLTAADDFDVDLLNQASRLVKLMRPRIRPVKTPRGDRFCVFLSPEQVYSLRQSDSIWFTTMQNALKGGRIDDNPLFTNALGEWSNFVFFESDWIPPCLRTDNGKIAAGTRCAWVGGAQSLFMAYGRGSAPQGYGLNRYRWDKETEDFGAIGQIAATTIVGMARPRYKKPGEPTERENGVVAIQTYADFGGQITAEQTYAPWIDAGATI